MYVGTKIQSVKFPWDLYWENKPYKLKRSIPRNPVQQENPGGEGLLNKCLFEDAPPRGPTSYPLYTIFHEKDTPSCEACGET